MRCIEDILLNTRIAPKDKVNYLHLYEQHFNDLFDYGSFCRNVGTPKTYHKMISKMCMNLITPYVVYEGNKK